MMERVCGHNARGWARRVGVVRSQSISPWAPSARNCRRRFAACGIESGLVTPTTSNPCSRAALASAALRAAGSRGAFSGKVVTGSPQKMRALKKLARASDSTDWKSALEVEIGVGFRRRYPRQRFGEQRTERWSRLHARVPGLRDLVFVP